MTTKSKKTDSKSVKPAKSVKPSAKKVTKTIKSKK